MNDKEWKRCSQKNNCQIFYLECQQYYVGLSCYMYVDFQRAIIQWFLDMDHLCKQPFPKVHPFLF